MNGVFYLEKVEKTPKKCHNERGHNNKEEPMVVPYTP